MEVDTICAIILVIVVLIITISTFMYVDGKSDNEALKVTIRELEDKIKYDKSRTTNIVERLTSKELECTRLKTIMIEKGYWKWQKF